MKKTILKTVVATAVVAATMAVSSVAAFAATYTWTYEDNQLDFPAEFGTITYDHTDTLTGDSSRKATFKESIFSDGTNKLSGKTGLDISKQTVDTGRIIQIEPNQDGRYEFFAVRTGGSSTEFRTYIYENDDKTQLNTISPCGRDTLDIEPLILDAKAGNKYAFYANSSSGCGLFAIRFSTGDSIVYWPTTEEKTDSSSSWLGGTPTTYLNAQTLSNGAENVGGNLSSSSRIRIGKKAWEDAGKPDPVTSANMGYITFPGFDGKFTVTISAGSSSDQADRPFCLGIVKDNGFEKIADLETVNKNVKGDVTTVVENGSSTVTYAVYVEPKADGTAAENTDIYGIVAAPEGISYVTTPEITLSDVTSEGGKISVTATINNFSKSYYEVDKITLNAAKGSKTAEAAKWTNNNIANLKANDDGTVTFIATTTDPGEDAKFQAIVHYTGTDTLTAGTDKNAASNAVTYTVAE